MLRQLRREVNQTKVLSLKAIKKPKRKLSGNNESGFMKPVMVSEKMSKFAGWDPSELKSRVDVTRFLCTYIKQHQLQNPNDRREIIADDNLKELLGYDDQQDQLAYKNLQRYIQPLFKKHEKEA
jgi:upstream activation factor subunit UAF30